MGEIDRFVGAIRGDELAYHRGEMSSGSITNRSSRPLAVNSSALVADDLGLRWHSPLCQNAQDLKRLSPEELAQMNITTASRHRVYGKFRADNEHTFATGAPGKDDYQTGQAGFRIASDRNAATSWFLSRRRRSRVPGALREPDRQ